eukprot:Sspe_Gene.68274::Locus_40281_Transcript_1_1_Confidence_1.000_Length_962::g.68274::m.68274
MGVKSLTNILQGLVQLLQDLPEEAPVEDNLCTLCLALQHHYDVSSTVYHPKINQRTWCIRADPFLAIPCSSGNDDRISIKGSDISIRNNVLIVDLVFLDRFTLHKPPPGYQHFMDTLPSTFIGTFSELNNIMYTIGDKMADAFRERKRELPPWRTVQSLRLSYWFLDPQLATPGLLPIDHIVQSCSHLPKTTLDMAALRKIAQDALKKTSAMAGSSS